MHTWTHMIWHYMVAVWPLKIQTLSLVLADGFHIKLCAHTHTPSFKASHYCWWTIQTYVVFMKKSLLFKVSQMLAWYPALIDRKTKSWQTSESRGVRGHEAVDCAERVEATDREGIHCALHDVSHLFCLFKPGSHPLFAAVLSLPAEELTLWYG